VDGVVDAVEQVVDMRDEIRRLVPLISCRTEPTTVRRISLGRTGLRVARGSHPAGIRRQRFCSRVIGRVSRATIGWRCTLEF
jgi:hypothetical protein